MHHKRNRKNPILILLLNTVSLIFKSISLLLLIVKGFFSKKFTQIKIISINNLSFGGTGKSSAILKIGKTLEQNNISFSVITRGYKSQAENYSVKVQPSHSAAEIGDEGMMFKQHFPDSDIFSGKKKCESIQKAIALNNKVVIIDDGFQSTNIKKDLNLMLFNAKHPFYFLRNFKFLIKSQDFILFYKELNTTKAQKSNSGIYNFKISGFKTCHSKDFNLKKEPIVAFSALGDNQRFKKSLNNYNLKEFHPFRDHHHFTLNDLKMLQSTLHEKKADFLVCTAKDFTKISHLNTDGIPILYAVNEIIFDQKFCNFLNVFLKNLK